MSDSRVEEVGVCFENQFRQWVDYWMIIKYFFVRLKKNSIFVKSFTINTRAL